MNKSRLTGEFLKEFQNFDFSLIIEKKVGLVGSLRFKEHFTKIESILQINFKKLVYICSTDGLLNKSEFSPAEWESLQEICVEKLKSLDCLLVLDVENYIGEHTREEIEFFHNQLHKPIYYLSDIRRN